MRVLLKLSGESVSDGLGINYQKVKEVVSLFNNVKDLGHEIVIVVGGGNFHRGRENTNLDAVTSDTIGMLATIMNALTLKDAFINIGIPSIVSTPFNFNQLLNRYTDEELRNKIKEGSIIIFGGGIGESGYSTDSAASKYASLMHCDLIIKLTNVDGVYDSDPRINENAKMYEKITFDEVIQKKLKVMDENAFIECKNNNISIRVINFNNQDNLLKAINNECIGTIISNEVENER